MKSHHAKRIARLERIHDRKRRKEIEIEAIEELRRKAIAQGISPDGFDAEVKRMREAISGLKTNR